MAKSTFCRASARADLQNVDLDWELGLRSRSGGDIRRRAYGPNDVDRLSAALLTGFHGPRSGGGQRVIAAAADVDAGVEVGAALAHDDFARLDDLSAEPLDAEALGVRVATVA